MATVSTPVSVNIWLDPPMTAMAPPDSSVLVRFAFTDPDTLLPVNPDVVKFEYRQLPEASSWTTLTFGTGFLVDAPLVQDDVGEFHVALTLAAPGKWALRVLASSTLGTPTGSATRQVFVPAVAA